MWNLRFIILLTKVYLNQINTSNPEKSMPRPSTLPKMPVIWTWIELWIWRFQIERIKRIRILVGMLLYLSEIPNLCIVLLHRRRPIRPKTALSASMSAKGARLAEDWVSAPTPSSKSVTLWEIRGLCSTGPLMLIDVRAPLLLHRAKWSWRKNSKSVRMSKSTFQIPKSSPIWTS